MFALREGRGDLISVVYPLRVDFEGRLVGEWEERNGIIAGGRAPDVVTALEIVGLGPNLAAQPRDNPTHRQLLSSQNSSFLSFAS